MGSSFTLRVSTLLLLRSRTDAPNSVLHHKAPSPARRTPSLNSLATVWTRTCVEDYAQDTAICLFRMEFENAHLWSFQHVLGIGNFHCTSRTWPCRPLTWHPPYAQRIRLNLMS
ncbi:uncharacterized protein HD556DRAFT_746045 [Suillus plorans]|uniref:Uncharacterized protein n=1 Tax=Suillus plorans TaxID=116603 RepID=A0A9P7AIH5_9AGAM|nr:uncharacterized protein HD556DRAFT_746045 [Suillus plorans]KAG1790062.1 hypothetical protein HD556DRAFT_746045 [Suillus plorans]